MQPSHAQRFAAFFVVALFVGSIVGVGIADILNGSRASNSDVVAPAPAPAPATTPRPTARPTPVSESESPTLDPLKYVPRDMFLTPESEDVLEYRGGNWTIIVGADMSFRTLLFNVLLSLRPYGLAKYVRVFCYDPYICQYLTEAGVKVLTSPFYEEVGGYYYSHVKCPTVAEDSSSMGIQGPNDPKFSHALIMLIRVLYHARLLDNGVSFITFDADVCFHADPLSLFIPNDEVDIITAAHTGDAPYRDFFFKFVEGVDIDFRLNNGIGSFRSSKAALEFLGKGMGLTLSRMCDVGFPQSSYNRLVFDNIYPLNMTEPIYSTVTPKNETVYIGDMLFGTSPEGAKIQTTPFTAYASACHDLINPPTRLATVVHANCEPDVASKSEFLANKHCWYLRDDYDSMPRTGNMLQWLESIDVRTNPPPETPGNGNDRHATAKEDTYPQQPQPGADDQEVDEIFA